MFCNKTQYYPNGLAHVICKTLIHLYDISLSSKIVPGEWKLARITPIYNISMTS